MNPSAPTLLKRLTGPWAVHTLHERHHVARPLSEVFRFFGNPENLADLTPAWLDFRMVTRPPVRMVTGLVIEYRIRPFGFPMRWVSVIEAYTPPAGFVDVQRAGPYAEWRHVHRFIEDATGTWIEDEVTYALPFGFLGEIAHWLFVRRQLRGIFAYRTRVMQRIFG